MDLPRLLRVEQAEPRRELLAVRRVRSVGHRLEDHRPPQRATVELLPNERAGPMKPDLFHVKGDKHHREFVLGRGDEASQFEQGGDAGRVVVGPGRVANGVVVRGDDDGFRALPLLDGDDVLPVKLRVDRRAKIAVGEGSQVKIARRVGNGKRARRGDPSGVAQRRDDVGVGGGHSFRGVKPAAGPGEVQDVGSHPLHADRLDTASCPLH